MVCREALFIHTNKLIYHFMGGRGGTYSTQALMVSVAKSRYTHEVHACNRVRSTRSHLISNGL